jgi:hypothetical protein
MTVDGPPGKIHAPEVRAFAPPAVTPHFRNESPLRCFPDPAKLPVKQGVPKNGHGRPLSKIFTIDDVNPGMFSENGALASELLITGR